MRKNSDAFTTHTYLQRTVRQAEGHQHTSADQLGVSGQPIPNHKQPAASAAVLAGWRQREQHAYRAPRAPRQQAALEP